jgi:hypothetical protein
MKPQWMKPFAVAQKANLEAMAQKANLENRMALFDQYSARLQSSKASS